MSKSFSSDFRGEKGPIQTPFEVVTGMNISKDEVSYQVFIAPTDNGIAEFEAIKDAFLNKEPVFNITLGTANFSASITDIQCAAGEDIKVESPDDFVLVHSAIPSAYVTELQFNKDDFDSYNFVEEDMMPGDFVANENREVRKMNRIVFSTTPNPLRVKVTQPLFRISLNNEPLNIQFMDA